MSGTKGFIFGAVIAGAVGFGLGYNEGRGAPLLTNPFDDYEFAERLRDSASEIEEEVRERLDDVDD